MRTNQKLSSAGMVTKVSNISTKKETNHQSHRAVPTYTTSCGQYLNLNDKILQMETQLFERFRRLIEQVISSFVSFFNF